MGGQVIHLTVEELETFRELPAEWLKAYLYLRRFVDARGIVGTKRTISRQAIREWLEVPTRQGRCGETFSLKQVTRMLEGMAKAGLIRSMPTPPSERRLVFLLPMAIGGKVRPKKVGQVLGREEGQVLGRPQTAEKKGKTAITSAEVGQTDTPDVGHASLITKDSPSGESIYRSNNHTRFEDFWRVYPKKVGKKPCLAKWKARRLDDMADMLITDIKRRMAHDRRWIEGYIPNPLTYINQDRWEDEIEPVIRPVPSAGGVQTQTKRGMTAADRWLANQGGAK